MPGPVSDTAMRSRLCPSASTAEARISTRPLAVNFTALPARLNTTWRSRPGIEQPLAAQQVVAADAQLQPLVARLRPQHVHDFLHQGGDLNRLAQQRAAAGLAAGHLQQAVQHAQQRPAAAMHAVQPGALFLLQLAVQQQFADAHDAGHRRADVVAEGGEQPMLVRRASAAAVSAASRAAVAAASSLTSRPEQMKRPVPTGASATR